MMDWCLGHDVCDLVVSKNEEYFDRLPSPDSWSQWGTQNLRCSNKFDTEKIVRFADEKTHHQRILFGRGNSVISQPEGDCSFGCTSADSLQRNSAACGRPEYQLNNLVEDDPMDDIFLSSLLQDDFPTSTHNHNPLGLPPQSAESESTNMIMEYQSISSETDNVCFGNCSGESNGSSVKALETMGMLPYDSRGFGDEDSSMEESVLLGLETVLNQMSNSTRICFRDSLYRLAQRSEQQVEGLSLNKSSIIGPEDGQTRSTIELRTNTIDRAVANLIFNEASTNIHDHFPAGCNYASKLPVDSKFLDFQAM